MLADLQTIAEKKGSLDLSGVSLAYAGDACNNVTYDLMRAGIIMGMDVRVTAPPTAEFLPEADALAECAELEKMSGAGTARVFESAEEAVAGADVVYTDSWMSYGESVSQRPADVVECWRAARCVLRVACCVASHRTPTHPIPPSTPLSPPRTARHRWGGGRQAPGRPPAVPGDIRSHVARLA